MSQRLQENHRVVDPASTPSTDFDSKMQALFKQLFPEHDLTKHPVHFFLMDSDRIGHKSFVTDGHSFIGFTTQTVRSMKTTDELAYLVATEVIANQITPNPRPEKAWPMTLGVTGALEVLHERHFDATAALRVQDALENEPRSQPTLSDRTIFEWDLSSRRSMVEKGLGHLRFKRESWKRQTLVKRLPRPH
ncbi:MAG: hypothetical protein R3B54_00875 [Bdellovibrionota bacterium]